MKKLSRKKPFDAKVYGNFVDRHYWLSDGHIAINTSFFTAKLPKACAAFADLHEVFRYDLGHVDKDGVPPIERIVTKGARYILQKTQLTHINASDNAISRVFVGHTRIVYMDNAFMDILLSGVMGDKLNFLQNYDKPDGAIFVYHNKQDIDAELPIAVVMPMRIGDESHREVLNACQGVVGIQANIAQEKAAS